MRYVIKQIIFISQLTSVCIAINCVNGCILSPAFFKNPNVITIPKEYKTVYPSEIEEVENIIKIHDLGIGYDKIGRAHPLYKFLQAERKRIIKLDFEQRNRNYYAELRKYAELIHSVKNGTFQSVFNKEQIEAYKELFDKMSEACQSIYEEMDEIMSNNELSMEEKTDMLAELRLDAEAIHADVFERNKSKLERTGALSVVESIIPKEICLWDTRQRDPRRAFFDLPPNAKVEGDVVWDVRILVI